MLRLRNEIFPTSQLHTTLTLLYGKKAYTTTIVIEVTNLLSNNLNGFASVISSKSHVSSVTIPNLYSFE